MSLAIVTVLLLSILFIVSLFFAPKLESVAPKAASPFGAEKPGFGNYLNLITHYLPPLQTTV